MGLIEVPEEILNSTKSMKMLEGEFSQQRAEKSARC
jgi:hypothetical protein